MKVTPTDSNALVVIADGHYDSAAPTLWVLSEMVDRVFFDSKSIRYRQNGACIVHTSLSVKRDSLLLLKTYKNSPCLSETRSNRNRNILKYFAVT